MTKSKLLLLALLGFGVLVCSDAPEKPPAFYQRVKNFCKIGLQSLIVPVVVAGLLSRTIFENIDFGKKILSLSESITERPVEAIRLGGCFNPLFWITKAAVDAKLAPRIGGCLLYHREILNKFLAASSSYALAQLIPGFNKKDDRIPIACAVAATLGVLL